MSRKNIIYNLVIANLILIFFYMIGKFELIGEFFHVVINVVVMPIIFGTFLFYILRPLKNFFVKKGCKNSIASTITLVIAIIFVAVVSKIIVSYVFGEFNNLRTMILSNIQQEKMMELINKYLPYEEISGYMEEAFNKVLSYGGELFTGIKTLIDEGMMIFSNALLIVLIIMFLLKGGDAFKPSVLKYVPKKYKNTVDSILSDGDKVLSTYIIGQATVALALASMVFAGYLIIKMPSALLFAFITFILAFIPFIGFFISMIIPYILAFTLGLKMLIKLTILVIIAQTIKGRVVVPFIMGKAMKIHPLTDIFLVVGSAALGGPLAAFVIIPFYSLGKLIIKKLIENNVISLPWIVDKNN